MGQPKFIEVDVGDMGTITPELVVVHRKDFLAPIRHGAEFRASIMALQDAMVADTANHIDLPLKHHFAPGSYGREIFIPGGSTVIGKIHKHGHLNIISRGHGVVATEFERVEYDARTSPVTFVSLPGTKRAVVALSDTVWTTFHVTDQVTPEAVEAEIIAVDYAELDMDRLTADIEVQALKDDRK